MPARKYFEGLCLFSFCALFFGCATQRTTAPMDNSVNLEQLSPGVYLAYRPVSRPELTPELAKQDLKTQFAGIQRAVGVKYLREDGANKFPNLGALVAFINSIRTYSHSYRSTEPFVLLSFTTPTIAVADDKIAVPLAPLFFSEMAELNIMIVKNSDLPIHPYAIKLSNLVSIYFHMLDFTTAVKIADDLLAIQEPLKKQMAQEFALFEKQAQEYRALAVKPAVSEEQRKFIVQANALSQQKNYAEAISLYQKAVAVHPTAYPSAYFNMALLSANERLFLSAMRYMKMYLLLAPDAKDARNAQDKIYEWELMAQKS